MDEIGVYLTERRVYISRPGGGLVMNLGSSPIRRAVIGAITVAAISVGGSQSAHAWGAQGHEYVGNLGFQVLNPKARSQVAALLGPHLTLGQAAVWADCVRSVDGSASTPFKFQVDRYTPNACRVFDDNGVEEARITDYAQRNWTNCEYSHKRFKCNLAYHFADVNVHDRQHYELGYTGTGSQDVVQVIKAAIIILRCPATQTCTAPAGAVSPMRTCLR
jgi:hypothetical protein